ncbi:hypothetical protein [Gryllotalpicola protaetiae]|uniref:Uncharacterized protein n=1 Tax=Gryllotalpicola protaetiae TaxID=2419771 RepID=A0A387BQ97_9MICO|nr:hypothetical protein [Gryllotalpicola protaetiae]AYG03200.1 hypothetical protein D7I44_06420 [Gryllotalpicola protaetiae]
MDRRQQRALRGAGAAALAVFVAAFFHVAGGGAAPSPLALGASFVLAAPACVLLAGRRPALWRLALSVALSQFALHFLFGLGQPSDVRFDGDTAMAGMPGMRLDVAGGAGAAATSSMWAGHVAAALVTIVAIRHGENLLRRMLELAVRFVVRAISLSSVLVSPRRLVAARRALPAVLAPQFLSGAWSHRGPPVRFAL